MPATGSKFNPLNRGYIPCVKSYLVAYHAIRRYYLGKKPLSEDGIKALVEKYDRGMEHTRKAMAGMKGDYRVLIYSFAFGDFKRSLVHGGDAEQYGKAIMHKDQGAVLTALEKIAEPGKNHRMDKRPLEYSLENVEMLFYLMDVGHEFSQDFSPAIATLDLGSRLESMPMILGTDTYYMTYDKKKEHLSRLHADYPQIIAVQRFGKEEALAIAYNAAGMSVLMSIKSPEDTEGSGRLEMANSSFNSAWHIRNDYPDALEGQAYAARLMGNRGLADTLYNDANNARTALERKYALFLEGKLQI